MESKALEHLTFDYKPKLWLMLLAAAFFGATAVILGYVAVTNDRGLILNRIIDFSASSASIFYGVLCIFSLGLVGLGIRGAVASLGEPNRITLGGTEISAPKNAMSKTMIAIPYSEIINISEKVVQKQAFLVVQSRQKKIEISRSSLASKGKFLELREALIQRIPLAG